MRTAIAPVKFAPVRNTALPGAAPAGVKRVIRGATTNVLVDTGAEFSWINANTLKKAGVNRENKSYRFVTATGQEITRPIGLAVIHVGDAVTTDEVVFGEPGDLEILGARTLEGMNLRVDSRAKKLVSGGPILAASDLAIVSGHSVSDVPK